MAREQFELRAQFELEQAKQDEKEQRKAEEKARLQGGAGGVGGEGGGAGGGAGSGAGGAGGGDGGPSCETYEERIGRRAEEYHMRQERREAMEAAGLGDMPQGVTLGGPVAGGGLDLHRKASSEHGDSTAAHQAVVVAAAAATAAVTAEAELEAEGLRMHREHDGLR